MAPMLTLSRAALALHGVSPAGLGRSALTVEQARALEPVLKSRRFDVDQPIQIKELPGFQGFHLSQETRSARATVPVDGAAARVAPEGSSAGDWPRDAPDLIHTKIAIGHLPRKISSKTLVGPGSGHLCDGCEQRIHATELEHEVDLGLGTLRFHASCARFWAEASAAPQRDVAGGSAASAWSLLFDLGVARTAWRDPAARAELLYAGAETRIAATQMRALSGAIRARSMALRAHARRLRLGRLSSASC
jgi:hypothetical protein